MERAVRPALIVVLLAPLALAQTSSSLMPAATSLEREFAAGGRLELRLSSGTYTIRSGADNKIRIRWETRKPEQLKKVKIDIQAANSGATVRTHTPRNSDFQAVIELPERTDLHVRLSAGDLQITGIEGNKDVECHAGDITINIGSAAEYARVDASARAGDIEAPPFKASKGGLFRRFQWQGKGKYSLHVHVGAGSITLLGVQQAAG
jgi:hypothetical protein